MTHAQLTEKINLLGYQGVKEAYQRQSEDITYTSMSFEERVYQLLDAQEIFLYHDEPQTLKDKGQTGST